MNNGIVIDGKIYKLTECDSPRDICHECDLYNICAKGNTNYQLCVDIHNVNKQVRNIKWYNYKEVKVEPVYR